MPRRRQQRHGGRDRGAPRQWRVCDQHTQGVVRQELDLAGVWRTTSVCMCACQCERVHMCAVHGWAGEQPRSRVQLNSLMQSSKGLICILSIRGRAQAHCSPLGKQRICFARFCITHDFSTSHFTHYRHRLLLTSSGVDPSPHRCLTAHTPTQGLVADEAVVVATLFVNGKSHGAQAFLVQMRDDVGKSAVGIGAEDMGASRSDACIAFECLKKHRLSKRATACASKIISFAISAALFVGYRVIHPFCSFQRLSLSHSASPMHCWARSTARTPSTHDILIRRPLYP